MQNQARAANPSVPGHILNLKIGAARWSQIVVRFLVCFVCRVLVSGLCPSCGQQLVLNLSCINMRGHMYVIHSNASSYSHIDIDIYVNMY